MTGIEYLHLLLALVTASLRSRVLVGSSTGINCSDSWIYYWQNDAWVMPGYQFKYGQEYINTW